MTQIRNRERLYPFDARLMNVLQGFLPNLASLFIMSHLDLDFAQVQTAICHPGEVTLFDGKGQRFLKNCNCLCVLLRSQEDEQPLSGKGHHQRATRRQFAQCRNRNSEGRLALVEQATPLEARAKHRRHPHEVSSITLYELLKVIAVFDHPIPGGQDILEVWLYFCASFPGDVYPDSLPTLDSL